MGWCDKFFFNQNDVDVIMNPIKLLKKKKNWNRVTKDMWVDAISFLSKWCWCDNQRTKDSM